MCPVPAFDLAYIDELFVSAYFTYLTENREKLSKIPKEAIPENTQDICKNILNTVSKEIDLITTKQMEEDCTVESPVLREKMYRAIKKHSHARLSYIDSLIQHRINPIDDLIFESAL